MCLLRFGTAATGGAGSLLSASPASRFWTRTGLSPPKQTLLNFLAPSRAPLSGAPRGGTVADFRGPAPAALCGLHFGVRLRAVYLARRERGAFWAAFCAFWTQGFKNERVGLARWLSAGMVIAAFRDFSVRERPGDCVGTSRARYVQHAKRAGEGVLRAHPHPPADRSTDGDRGKREVYFHYIFRSLHTLTPKTSVGVSVGDLSVVSTDGASPTGHLSAFPTDTDRSPTVVSVFSNRRCRLTEHLSGRKKDGGPKPSVLCEDWS